MRFSLRGLIAFVVVTGAWLYAVMNPWNLLVVLFTSVALVTLVAALILWRVSQHRRTFWTGFALAGWIYLLLTLPPYSFEHIRQFLPTDHLLRAYTRHLSQNASGSLSVYPMLTLDAAESFEQSMPDGTVQATPYYNFVNIAFIGHCYFALLFGLIAGAFAAWIERREKRAADAPPTS